MTDFLEDQLTKLNASVDRHSLGKEPGTELQLPDVIIAKYPKAYDSKKKTVLIYGHYDVQPPGEGVSLICSLSSLLSFSIRLAMPNIVMSVIPYKMTILLFCPHISFLNRQY